MTTTRKIKLLTAAALGLACIGLTLCGLWMVGAPLQCVATCLLLDLI